MPGTGPTSFIHPIDTYSAFTKAGYVLGNEAAVPDAMVFAGQEKRDSHLAFSSPHRFAFLSIPITPNTISLKARSPWDPLSDFHPLLIHPIV